jgi:hypothetical protein
MKERKVIVITGAGSGFGRWRRPNSRGPHRDRSDTPACITHHSQEINMIESIARWGHNVLITLMGLLTIAMVVSAT